MNAILHDRSAQMLMALDDLGYDQARGRLERAAVVVETDPDLDDAHQALLLAAVSCALKMFKGGVFLTPQLDGRLTIGQNRAQPLRRALLDIGAKTIHAPDHAVGLHVGPGQPQGGPALHVWCDGWRAVIGPHAPQARPAPANILAGMAGGGMAIAELFRKAVLDDVRACKQRQDLSVWGASPPDDATLGRLPQKAWLLGLGNLGQAVLFGLSLLPWKDPGEVTLVLNDADTVGPENLPVQILTTHAWIGRKKARAAAEWAEARGFKTIIDERRFNAGTALGPDDPRLALVGVDNLEARRHAAGAGFDLVIDAGLGATGPEAFDIRLHAFPGAQTPASAWPIVSTAPRAISKALSDLVTQGRLDACGAMTIAGSSVGVPCTAMVAAALQLAQACRALDAGLCADKIDVSLADLRRAKWRDMTCSPQRTVAGIEAL